MASIKGLVEAKARTGKSIKVGEAWYAVRDPSALARVEKGMMVAFDFTQNGTFNNIDPKTIRTKDAGQSPSAPAAPKFNNLGVELGHAANLAMTFHLKKDQALDANLSLDDWQHWTKEIYERMKDMRAELEQGNGHFNRELANPAEDSLDEDDLF